MEGRFEWDPAKSRSNKKKHGVSFENAVTVFEDAFAILEPDEVDEFGEMRWRAIGHSRAWAVLVVVHVERDGGSVIRIISARKANPGERARYEQDGSNDSV